MRDAGSHARIRGLDGIRACAIASVMCAHAMAGDTRVTSRIGHFLADLGVRAFFVLSGFLITSLLVREHERTGHIALRDFYMRRALRIFPALYAFLAIVLAFSLADLRDIAYAASYMMNFHGQRGWTVGHLWSLAVEEQFYLLWPGILVVAGLSRGRRIAIVAIVLAPVVRLGVWYGWPAERALADQAFPCVWDGLGVGCAFALYRAEIERVGRRVFDAGWFWPACCAAIALTFATTPWFALGPAISLSNIAIALILHHVTTRPSRMLAVLEQPRIVWVGGISYSLYLWQQLFLNRHATSLLTTFPLNVVLALIAAAASARWIEAPFLRRPTRSPALSRAEIRDHRGA